MKQTISRNLSLLLLLWMPFCANLAIANPAQLWSSNHQEVLARAKAENKPILLNFTGSDWCTWCHKLDEEVFSRPEFLTFARQNLILQVVDFPRTIELPQAVRHQNMKLQRKFRVRGYPTVIILNSEGEQIGQMGYMRGGPRAFLAALQRILQAPAETPAGR